MSKIHTHPIYKDEYNNNVEFSIIEPNLIISKNIPKNEYNFDPIIYKLYELYEYLIIANPYENISLYYTHKLKVINELKNWSKFYNKKKNNIKNNIKIKNNKAIIYKNEIIPISSYNELSYNKYYELFQLFNYNKQFLLNMETAVVETFEIIGPDEIKNYIVYPVTDYLEIFSLFRKSIYNLNINDKFIFNYKIISWGEDISFKKIYNKFENNNNIRIKYNIINNFTKSENIKKSNKKRTQIYIREHNYYTINYCISESSRIHQLLIYFVHSLINLKIDGTIIIELQSLFTKPLIQLLYFVNLHFKKTIFFICNVGINTINNRYLLFTGFNGISKNNIYILFKLIDQLYEKDNSIGLHINDKKQYKYCKNYKFKSNHKEIFIQNLFNIKILPEFVNFINNANIFINKHLHKYIHYIFDIKNNLNNAINKEQYIYNILKQNLKRSIKWCEKYNISINLIKDSENFIINKKDILKLIFPFEKNIDFNKLKLTSIGKYSFSKNLDSELITQKIIENLENLPNSLIITDATSGNGGNVINFTKHFKFVNAIELNKLNFSILENNIKVYNRKNIKLHNINYLYIYRKLTQDIIFIDPPWGGINYKLKTNISLFLDDINICNLIDELKKYSKMIVLKVPINFNYIELFKIVKTNFIKIYQISNFIIIIIKF